MLMILALVRFDRPQRRPVPKIAIQKVYHHVREQVIEAGACVLDFISQAMIVIGFALMVFNIVSVVRFIQDQRDVLTGKSEVALSYVILAFVVLFATVYAYIFFQSFEELSIGVILLSGSAFVTVVLQWIYRLVSSIKKNAMDIAEALSIVIDARDRDLRGHSRHVEAISALLYDALPESQRRTINKTNLEYAAIFHDLGKLGVAEEILNKPSKLSESDWMAIRRHPRIGVEILRPVSSFRGILSWIEYHHERVDGKGYYGIPSKEIPLAARIITVADVFSALLMKRPYKEAASYDECIAIMKSCAGTQLDADLVELFCTIPKEKVMDCSSVLFETPEEV